MFYLAVSAKYSPIFFVLLANVMNFRLTTVDVLTGQRHANAICGRFEVHDDGVSVHRGEGKAIINGCTDREKKSYCFANGCLRRVSVH